MQFQMRAVGLEFLTTARRVWIVEDTVRAPRTAVWRAYVDPGTWPHWFPGVRSASYVGAEPYGVGTRRVADVSGRRFEEMMVAWDEGRRWAYYIEHAAAPFARAQLECTEFEDAPEGTRLRWTIAADPRLLLRLGAPFFQGTVSRLFRRACRNLEAHLRLDIRTYEPGDRDAVWELHNSALDEVDAHGGNGPWDDDLHEIPKVYLASGGDFVVGVIAGRIAAMGALLPSGDGRGEIKRMRVRPQDQGRGLGAQILEELESRARQKGLRTLHLDTTTRQQAARRLYERNGFVETGRGQLGPFELVYYAKALIGVL